MQVLAALQATNVPVPRALCLATDSSIIGTLFYVMEHVQVCVLDAPLCQADRLTSQEHAPR